MTKTALIFGAGKIGRGFIGQLLFRSGYTMTFVDPARALVDQLNVVGEYPVTVRSSPPQTDHVKGFHAICLDDRAAVLDAVSRHGLFFTAVGGANLDAVGNVLAAALARRLKRGERSPANVILCENWKDAAADLRKSVTKHAPDETFRAWADSQLGLVETQVLRPCYDPPAEERAKNPLAIFAQDWWILPCDGDAIRGEVPPVQGLEAKRGFQHELIRKVYTYNCINAVFAYLGYLRGYTLLQEAAFDDEIVQVAIAAHEEGSHGLIAEYGFSREDQEQMKQQALRKYQDRRSPDPIERNARDSRRKLSPEDRLLGPARLAWKHGRTPTALALGAAAALHYDGSNDAGTAHVQALIRRSGLAAAIEGCCGVKTDSPIGKLILESVPKLERFNRRGIKLAQ